MCIVFSEVAHAESYGAYVYGKKRARMSGQLNAQIGHVQNMQVATFTSEESNMRVQHVKSAVRAQVESINLEQGFGHVKVEGERLFFHSSQLIGCAIHELAKYDTMSFDIVFNPRTNKFLAKNVRREHRRQESQIGHFQNMEPVRFTSGAVEPAMVSLDSTCQGKVTAVTADYGFVETAAHGQVFFHYAQLVGTHMSEIAVGDVLTFSVGLNQATNKKIAQGVKRVPSRINAQIGHFQNMQVATFTSTAVTPNSVHLEHTVQGRIVKLQADHGFLDTANHGQVFFHHTALIGAHISELAIHDQLTFAVTFNKRSNRKVAQTVRKAPQPAKQLSAVKNLLQVESARLLRRLSQNLVINVQCDDEQEPTPESLLKQVATADKLSPFANLSNANSRRNSRRGSACSLIR